jgi:hypothetical protein
VKEIRMVSSATYAANGDTRTLGVCWVVYGLLRLILALGMVFVSGTATVMFGALLVRVPDPFTIMNLFHFMYIAAIVLSVLCSIVGVFAGLALLGGRPLGRTLGILAAILSLCEIPLGLTLGAYTLVVLLPRSPSASPVA